LAPKSPWVEGDSLVAGCSVVATVFWPSSGRHTMRIRKRRDYA
jgi:hypothetical protein